MIERMIITGQGGAHGLTLKGDRVAYCRTVFLGGSANPVETVWHSRTGIHGRQVDLQDARVDQSARGIRQNQTPIQVEPAVSTQYTPLNRRRREIRIGAAFRCLEQQSEVLRIVHLT